MDNLTIRRRPAGREGRAFGEGPDNCRTAQAAGPRDRILIARLDRGPVRINSTRPGNVRSASALGLRAGLGRGVSNGSDVPILLQNSLDDTSHARIESRSRMQRIKVAPLPSSTNQCCAPRPAKSFCNNICQFQTSRECGLSPAKARPAHRANVAWPSSRSRAMASIRSASGCLPVGSDIS